MFAGEKNQNNFFVLKNKVFPPGAASGTPADGHVFEPPLSNPRP